MGASESAPLEDLFGLRNQRLLDRYLVEACLARGGMSMIYRGRDVRLQRPVCIKVFLSGNQEDSGASRIGYDHFVQEAFALSQLQHPNTIRIYDFGHLEGG